MKKTIFIFLVCILVFSMMLTACGTQTSDSSKTTAASSAGTQAPAVTSTVAPAVPQEPEPFFGKYEKPVTVKLALRLNAGVDYPEGDDPSNNVWTRAWKDDLNIVEETMWGAKEESVGGPYETKMNLAIASNELPDIMQLSNYAQFDKLLRADKIEDLTGYYDKYAYPFLKQCVMEDGGLALSWGKVNGKLMGFPREGVDFKTPRMIYIRHDWFVKSGLPVPKTLEDVLALAKAFKAEDPKNRFGITLNKKVIGDGSADIVGLCNAVGAFPNQWIDDGSGKIVYGTIQPQMKKAIQIYADLYKQGLVDPAFASIDYNKVHEQITSGKVGIIFGSFYLPDWPLNTLWDSAGADWDMYPILPSADLSGPVKVQVNVPKGSLVVVRKGYEHPEVLFKLLNYTTAKIYDLEKAEPDKFYNTPVDAPKQYGFHMFNPIYIMWGPSKDDLNIEPNVTNAVDKKDESYLKSTGDKTWYPSVKKYADAIAANQKPDGITWAMAKYFYSPNSTFGILNYYMNNNNFLVSKLVGYETSEMVRQWSSMQQYEAQSIVEMISGLKPVDDFDKFVQGWKDMGGETITYEVNDWYKTIQAK